MKKTDKTSIGERIKLVRGSTPRGEIAQFIGSHRNTIARYEAGLAYPSMDFMDAFCSYYKLHPAWFLTGEGPMYKGENQDTQKQQKDDESSFDFIPMVEAKLSAGGGAFVESEEVRGYYAFRKDWVRRIASGPKDMVLMRVTGDSMSPTIQARDTVMIDTGRKDIKEGEIYAIRFDNTIMIKRLSFRPGDKLQIISDNKEYQPYEADIKDIHIIGQVVFFSRVLIHE